MLAHRESRAALARIARSMSLFALALASCGPLEERVFGVAAVSTVSDEVPDVAIGTQVADLDFTDALGNPRRLSEAARGRPLVIAFTTIGCPLAQRYLPVLAELEREYRDRGVAFLGLDVGAARPLEAASQALEHGIEFPLGKDVHGEVARACGATRSPEVALLDAEGTLRYRGRVDGRHRLAGARPDPGREDLREALDDLLAGREIAVEATAADGCLLEPERIAPDAGLTWDRDIAPIVAARCAPCHTPDGGAPFALLAHRDVARRSRVVEEVVATGRMPPWFAAAPGDDHGGYVEDLTLDDDERAKLLAWVRAGAPAGADAPTAIAPPPARTPTPDLVLESDPFEVPATGYIEYHHALLPHVFERETWVQSVTIEPSEPALVHHAVVGVVDMDRVRSDESHWAGWMRPLFVYVPGRPSISLPDGIGLRVPRGYALALQVHYVTDGRARPDRLRVGLGFPRATVERRLRTLVITDLELSVPPHAPAHTVTRTAELEHDVLVHSIFPHMHLRGRDLRVRALAPDGAAETLLTVPAYHFDWQRAYEFSPAHPAFPAGTRFEFTARYDNSAFNVLNPDPSVAVTVGEQTIDEMYYVWIFHTRAEEQLGIDVDPRTGYVVSRDRPRGAVQRPRGRLARDVVPSR